jgi:hypothetical protein
LVMKRICLYRFCHPFLPGFIVGIPVPVQVTRLYIESYRAKDLKDSFHFYIFISVNEVEFLNLGLIILFITRKNLQLVHNSNS